MIERFGRAASATPAMLRLFEQLRAVAPHTYPVVLRGEYATGRETLGEALHEQSRPASPCMVIDLASIPAALVESALFGHQAGSFTGRVTIRRGPFEEAESGTVILREIGAMPYDVQPKLLRLVELGKFKRVGDNVMRPFNGRLVVTTSRDLDELVEVGWFRADLRAALAAHAEFEVPPLRDRIADLPHLLAEAGLPLALAEPLSKLHWRGNFVRWQDFVAARDHAAAVTELELLEAIEAAPDDDGPRLVYADAISARDEVRAEWITHQVRLAQTPDDRKIRQAEIKLRQKHYKAFAGALLDVATTPVSTPTIVFERGFADGLVIEGETLRNLDAILAAAPLLTRISTYGFLESCVWTSPALRAIRGLDITSRLDSLTIPTIARCPYLTGLRALTLIGEPPPEDEDEPELDDEDIERLDFEALATSPHLAGVTSLTLRGYPFQPVNLAVLFGDRAVWTLTELSVDTLSPAHARLLVGATKASRLTILRVSGLDAESREILQALTTLTIEAGNRSLR